ncbi:MAG: YafY family transcriptional regulator [Propionibacteriaceae bacterium]|jgi:predicted DNA-binding transcriptional regulator YafY|nr:YafY family transcriptional regulator [Propionibacteriaceae bacterium]
MNRTDRLYAIREELRRAGPRGRTTEQLAALFEVSVRTIKRDLSTLQIGGFPAWSRPGPGGGYVVDAEATLPPVNLTPSEVSGLAVALATQTGQPYAAHARTALAKILAVTSPVDRDRANRLASRVWINHTDEPLPINPSVRKAVEEALATAHTLTLRYRDSDGLESERRVDPQFLGKTNGCWYLIAHCHLRDAIRWFRLDRIMNARLTRQPSTDRPITDIGTPPDSAHAISLE